MQLSYNVIKQTAVNDKVVLSPPSIYKFLDTTIKNKDEINIDEIIEKIKKQAELDSKKIILEANEKAQDIINKAKIQSQQILEDAKNIGYKEGYNSGYNDGYNKSLLDIKEEANKIIEEANQYLSEVNNEVNSYIEKSKNEIINLALEIAKEIIKSELSINSEAIIKCAQKALSKTKQKNSIILKTSINDYKTLKSRQQELELFIDSNSSLMIVADSKLSNGDIYIETTSGIIDATIETQIQAIAKKLLKE